MRMMSRHENSFPAIVNTGAVSPTIHEIDSNSRIRMPIASPRPIVRARSRCAAGRRWTRTEMKTTLSIPSTISMSVRETSAIQASGLVSSSMCRGYGASPSRGRR